MKRTPVTKEVSSTKAEERGRHPRIRVACAGWSIPAQYQHQFPVEGQHLQRYAARFNAVEINSSFYRPHQKTTYTRWAATVPADFSFAVKLIKEITHTRRLIDFEKPLDEFLSQVSGLGEKLGPILIQLPPSLRCDHTVAERFLKSFRTRYQGIIVCEPRHESWFTDAANHLFEQHHVGRVAADPALILVSAEPGGWREAVYYRWHGSPRMYYSAYQDDAINRLALKLRSHADSKSIWCVFDNTATGSATNHALEIMNRLADA